MSRKANTRRIGAGFQKCDPRLLMAGDVDVFVNDNDLFIVGDNAHNRVDVSTVDGRIRVTGTNWQGGTTVNNSFNAFEVDAALIDDIRVDMNGGDDRFFMNGVHLTGSSHTRVDITTDSGNDLVGIYNSSARDLEVDTNNGNDHVIVSYSAFTRDIDIDTDSGHDELDLYGAYAGDDIWIDMGTGNDDVAIQGTQARDLTKVDLGDGNDIAWFNGGTFHDVNIEGDKGDDRVTLQGVDINDDLAVQLDEGYDQLYIYNTDVLDNIYLHGGSDSDKLGASGNNFNAFLYDFSF